MGKIYVYDRYWGDFSFNGEILGIGYSGASGYINDTSASPMHQKGPIPAGKYIIKGPFNMNPDNLEHPTLGAGPVWELVPDKSNKMFGRDGFFNHGDNRLSNHSASEGCIISPHTTRVIFQDGDILQVV